MSRWYVGDVIPLEATFRTEAGILTDPAVVTCRITLPNGTTVSATPSSTVVGIWRATYTPLVKGIYAAQFKGTGSVAGVSPVDYFYVNESNPGL